MVLLLALHRVPQQTAAVPLSMIVLMDYVKRKSLPADLRCRVVLPSGDVSISVWDAPSLAALQEWLDLTLSTAEPGVMNTVHEVQEDFSFGLTTVLAQARAAEKVVAGSKSALDTLSRGAITASDSFKKQLEVFDNRTNLLTATGEAIDNLRTKTTQAMESERVAQAFTTISASLTSASTWLSSVKQSFAVPKAADSEAGARDEGQEELRTSLPADSMRQQQPPPFSLHQSRPLDVVREGEEGEEQHSPLPSERQAAAGGTAAAEFSALSADATVAPVLAADPVPAEAQASPADRSGSATFVLSDDLLETPALPASQHASMPLA